MPIDDAEFARIVLAGKRFSGGKLPISSMVELQRYQASILEAARALWISDHPDQQIPADFDSSFDLAVSDLEDGSAIVVLELPPEYSVVEDQDSSVAQIAPEYESYYRVGKIDFDRQMGIALDPEYNVLDAPLFGYVPFRELGSSLSTGDDISFGDPGGDPPVLSRAAVVDVFNPRAAEYDKAVSVAKIARHTKTGGYIAGRLTALNADRHNFTFASLHFGDVNGRYRDESRTQDLRAVLDSSSLAPVVRLQADLRFEGSRLDRLLDVQSVELLEIDGQPWSRKLVELASLTPDWDGEVAGAEMISFLALDAARDLMLGASQSNVREPSIFPVADGGVLMEWATSLSVTSVEVSPDGSFILFDLPPDSDVGSTRTTTVFTEALDFARGVRE